MDSIYTHRFTDSGFADTDNGSDSLGIIDFDGSIFGDSFQRNEAAFPENGDKPILDKSCNSSNGLD